MVYINRKAIICLLLSIYLFRIDCFSQKLQTEVDSSSKPTSDSVEIAIKKIRKEFNKINSDTSKLRIVKGDVSGQSTEGGTITKFYDGSILKKAVLVFYGETGKSINEYYFMGGQLFFCFEQNERYSKPMYEKKPSINRHEENRFYFDGQKLIRWINNKGKIVDRSLYPAKEKEILDDLKDIH